MGGREGDTVAGVPCDLGAPRGLWNEVGVGGVGGGRRVRAGMLNFAMAASREFIYIKL
jgi:hypothetical protein